MDKSEDTMGVGIIAETEMVCLIDNLAVYYEKVDVLQHISEVVLG